MHSKLINKKQHTNSQKLKQNSNSSKLNQLIIIKSRKIRNKAYNNSRIISTKNHNHKILNINLMLKMIVLNETHKTNHYSKKMVVMSFAKPIIFSTVIPIV